jgi:hypothetical protein
LGLDYVPLHTDVINLETGDADVGTDCALPGTSNADNDSVAIGAGYEIGGVDRRAYDVPGPYHDNTGTSSAPTFETRDPYFEFGYPFGLADMQTSVPRYQASAGTAPHGVQAAPFTLTAGSLCWRFR